MSEGASSLRRFFSELVRRRVPQTAIVYLAVGFATMEATDIVTSPLGLPPWATPLVFWSVLGAFPIVLAISWHFDLSLEGIARTEPRDAVDASGPSAVTAVPPMEHSIAVLPFANLSDEAGNEYFSDGITEEIINALAQIPGMHVAARTSSFSFKGKHEDVTRIGDRLKVANVLEGSVRRAGSQIRITVQMVSCMDGYHLWSETYDREMEDVFAIQDDIARSIAQRMTVELMQGAGAPLIRRHTENLDAYHLYLKGRYVWNRRTAVGLRQSIEFFDQAIGVDDRYALAYAGLADAYSILGWYRHLEPSEAFAKTKWSALAALEIDDSLPEAHTALAYARFLFDWDWEGAESAFRRALELNPRYTTALHWYAEYLMAMGRLDEAKQHLKRAIEIDPLSLSVATGVGWTLFFMGDFEAAIEQYEKVIRVDENFVIIPWFLGPAYVQAGDCESAIALYEDWIHRLENPTGLKACLAHAMAVSGRRDGALDLLHQLEARSPAVEPDYLALVQAGLGDVARSLDCLDAALERRCWPLVFLNVDPTYRPLHEEPRFAELLRKIGLVV